MNKLLILIIFFIFSNVVSAAEISGVVASYDKKLSGVEVTLSKINRTTQSDESITGVVYNFVPLTNTTTDRRGSFVFKNLNQGEYRINVTYNNITFGENVLLEDKAVVNFNLSGTIDGYVLKANNTLENIPVRLIDMTGIEITSTLTNNNGKYSFNKVNSGSYILEIIYENVSYAQLVNTSQSANFTVYDTTKDANIISVAIDHIILSRALEGIQVDEYVEFINSGNKVFFSKDRTWLGISTPQDITRFQTEVMECCLVREKDVAWVDPMRPLKPGERYSTQISYIFNPKSEPVFFNKVMIYNTSYISILSEKNNGFGIESRYAKKEIVSEGGKEFEVLTFMNVPQGQLLSTRITGYVPVQKNKEEFNYFIPVLAALIIGAVSYPLIRNKIKKRNRVITSSSSDDEPERVDEISQISIAESSGRDIHEMSFDELMAEKNSIFEAVLALDNDFNAGNISEREYKELKKEYKQKAILVLNQIKELVSNLDLSQPSHILEKIIAHVDDIEVLENMLEREIKGENRDEIKKMIEERIEDIERGE